jgi:hypothetical protein
MTNKYIVFKFQNFHNSENTWRGGIGNLFKPHNIELYPIVSYVDLCSCGTQFEFLNLINTGAVVVVIAW